MGAKRLTLQNTISNSGTADWAILLRKLKYTVFPQIS